MSSPRSLITLLLIFGLASPLSASAAEGDKPEVGNASAVQFTQPATVAADPTDPKQLLAACDTRVEICERDAVGGPYLAAAYMAIWGILFAFLIVIRRGQRRLELELKELERRLDDPGGSTT